jgi:hypothetical protein
VKLVVLRPTLCDPQNCNKACRLTLFCYSDNNQTTTSAVFRLAPTITSFEIVCTANVFCTTPKTNLLNKLIVQCIITPRTSNNGGENQCGSYRCVSISNDSHGTCQT